MAKLYEKLIERAERNTLRGHMPGHKGVPLLGVPAETIDFTELSDTGNLYDADDNVIREAERDAARAAGAAACVYSAGGSTLLIQGMLGVAAQRASAKGRTLRVLAARDAHRSFFNAMALLGGDADYIYPQYNYKWNISEGIRADDVRAVLAEREYDAVYVTSPTYYGALSDLAGISEACADAGVLLLVDAAHGGHLVWGGEELDAVPLYRRVCIPRDGKAKTPPNGRACGDASCASNGVAEGTRGHSPVPSLETHTAPTRQRHRALPVADAARCRCGQRSKNLLGDAEQNSSGTATGMDAPPLGIDPRCTYIMCCSAHKTLGSLGGGAFALMSSDELHSAMLASMQLFGSSSPSYVILASLDKALADASSDAGKAALARCIERTARLRERVAAMEGVRVLGASAAERTPAPQPIAEQSAGAAARVAEAPGDHPTCSDAAMPGANSAAAASCVPTARTCGAALDPTRFVFSIDGVSGFDVAEWLERERGVAAEMADSRNVVFIMTAQDSEADFARLEAAIADCAAAVPCRDATAGTSSRTKSSTASPSELARDAIPASARQERVCSLRAALFSPTETVILRDAAGRVAAEAIAPYPPGVPIIAPGEKISQKTIAFFLDIGYNVDKGVRVLVPRTSEREDIE